ncbi:hypothetical protein RDI58_007873 [Solanum bulbocastanum]|uniref:Uncharacterized protein n=1 Tax=Solanum bulbocastanum TaxID=147425 RepID=A0AAN8TUL0_SOLBU
MKVRYASRKPVSESQEDCGRTNIVKHILTQIQRSWSSLGNFRNKAKPGSGQSDRVGRPDHCSTVRSSSPFGQRQ